MKAVSLGSRRKRLDSDMQKIHTRFGDLITRSVGTRHSRMNTFAKEALHAKASFGTTVHHMLSEINGGQNLV